MIEWAAFIIGLFQPPKFFVRCLQSRRTSGASASRREAVEGYLKAGTFWLEDSESDPKLF